MVKIKFLGAAKEVGRSGVLIESEETSDAVLCDYGIKTDDGEQVFPVHVSGKKLSAIVLSHAHIDHSGGIPLFYISGSVPLYCTESTYQVIEVLLHDMLNISRNYLPFDRTEIFRMRDYARFLNYKKRQKVGRNTWITLFNAGHIPGSAMVLVEMDGKKILYTGDFNSTPTQLLDPANPADIPPLDVIVTEATYGTTDHLPRPEIEEKFLSRINQIIENGGSILVPAFGVSRSQEMLMVLTKNGKVPFPITLDGMARKIALIYKNNLNELRDPDAYIRALNQTHFINQKRRDFERNQAASRSGAIIAPSGMLKGCTARYYFERLMNNKNNAITLVSYQIEGTPGRLLLDQGFYVTNADEQVQIAAEVEHFDFSSHAGKSDIVSFLEHLTFRGAKQVYCVHGDPEILSEFAKFMENREFKVIVPESSQSITI